MNVGDVTAPLDDLHDHPDFDLHLHRVGGQWQATLWLYGKRVELAEVDSTSR